MSFFITLIEDSDAGRRALEDEPRVHHMIHHGLKLEEYRAFLHDLYHVVWHFCPVMAAAAARLGDDFREVRYELYERIEEEKGHEAWVLEDVEAVGGDVAHVRTNPPSAPVQAMIGFNYYGAERVHPADLWSQDWRWRDLPAETNPQTQPRAVDEVTHQLIEAQLLGLMRSNQQAVAAANMSELCAGLGKTAQATQVATLWKLAAAVFDMLDGRVARLRGRETKFGAFLDSTMDRYSDMVLYMGLMILYARVDKTPHMVLVWMAAFGSFMTSYARARAESLIPRCTFGWCKSR